MSAVEVRGRGIRLLDVVFWLGVVAVVFANVAVLVPAFTTVRLWEDEAFNLTVPLNVVRGLGYTSDGTLSGSELTPFDARISTGPVMLLPIAVLAAFGVDPVIAGRLVAGVGYSVLLGSLWVLGRRLGGRWIALIAAALPLAYSADLPPSPIQSPYDILGEVTAAGLLAAGLVALHRRPWLAGLLVGLAVQVKFVALLALPAFAIVALLDAPGRGLGERLRATMPRVLAAAACAAAPTIAFEAWKFVALGPSGYVENVRDFGGFLLSGGQDGYRVPPLEKLAALLGAWHLPWWVVGAAIVVVVALAAAGARAAARQPEALATAGARTDPRGFVVIAATAGVALVTYLAWWLVSSHTPVWLRHPAPGVLAFLPVVVAASVVLARLALQRWGARRANPTRILAVVLAVSGLVLLTVSLAGRVVAFPYTTWETLAGQREAARQIAELGYDELASPWGGPVSVIVMSGAHVGLIDAVDAVEGEPRVWPGEPPQACDVLLRAPGYTVCAPPES
ncbi:hypothetical protein [Agromyces sp. NPDC049794]|uniref:hypothetical protein n=1 Tax=unclassified Agromyces TaxID=2639701 RepID=UPI0033F492F9